MLNPNKFRGELKMSRGAESIYCRYIKRALDILLSALLIFFLLLPMLVIALAVRSESEGGAIFRQMRRGRGGKEFVCYKFRTMYTETPADAPTHELENPERWITKVGKILRKTSLDELPQLFNILRGEMSIIGPRPALWNQYDLIEERDKYGANDVRPGLTGWAQINGRDELEIDVKAKFDGEYVEKMSFAFDIKCFLKTITSVLKSEGFVEGSVDEIKENINNN